VPTPKELRETANSYEHGGHKAQIQARALRDHGGHRGHKSRPGTADHEDTEDTNLGQGTA